MFGERNTNGSHEQPCQSAGERGERPSDGEDAPHPHAEQPRHLGSEGAGPHLESEARPAEQHEHRQHQAQHRADDEDVETGKVEVGVRDLDPVLGEGGRESPVVGAPDGAHQGFDEDQESDRDHDRVELRLPVQGADEHALGHRSDDQAGDESCGEGEPVVDGAVEQRDCDVRRERRKRPLREVEDPRRPPDQDESECHSRVDDPVGDPVQGQVDEEAHGIVLRSPGSCVEVVRPPRARLRPRSPRSARG